MLYSPSALLRNIIANALLATSLATPAIANVHVIAFAIEDTDGNGEMELSLLQSEETAIVSRGFEPAATSPSSHGLGVPNIQPRSYNRSSGDAGGGGGGGSSSGGGGSRGRTAFVPPPSNPADNDVDLGEDETPVVSTPEPASLLSWIVLTLTGVGAMAGKKWRSKP